MEIKDINYQKKDEVKNYKVFILSEDKQYISGIDINNISEDEVAQLKDLNEKLNNLISKLIKKGFKKFSKNKILE